MPNNRGQKVRRSVAAQRAGVCTKTIDRWIAAGLIRSARITRPGSTRALILVDLESLDALTAEGTRQ